MTSNRQAGTRNAEGNFRTGLPRLSGSFLHLFIDGNERPAAREIVFEGLFAVPGRTTGRGAVLDCNAVELEESSIEFEPVVDSRPTMPEPLPVKLVAVADVRLTTIAGIETQLDTFYIKMLRFVRDEPLELVYRADNFRLRFDYVEPLSARDDLRPVRIEVLSLNELERELVSAEIEFERERGLVAGADILLLRDPAGNWVALSEVGRRV